MKKYIYYILCAGCLLSAAYPETTPFGKISLPLGKVSIKSSTTHTWEKAKPNRKVFVNDIIKTAPKSRCEISLMGGGKVRIGENSELELNSASVKPMEKKFDAHLKKGSVWVSAKAAFGEKKNIAIRTPIAVAAIRGTIFKAKSNDTESSVQVYEGNVDVNKANNFLKERKEKRKGFGQGAPTEKPRFTLGPVTEIKAPTQVSGPYEISLEDWISLAEGMQINIREDGKYHLFKFDQTKDDEDEFVRWNKQQDGQ